MAYLTRAPIDLAPLVASLAGPDRGGVTSFLGTVRDQHEGRSVVGIEYTAYQPMAEAECERIVGEARRRWPVHLALQHRLGELSVGEVAVAVVAAGTHRDEAFAACRWVIEQLKQRVPIWKRERYADGSEEWVDSTREGMGSGEWGVGRIAP